MHSWANLAIWCIQALSAFYIEVQKSLQMCDKKKYQHWKAAFLACVDQAPATAEYKLLQLKQCLAGEALKCYWRFRSFAAAYQAAKERLERKFDGQCQQLAIYLEEMDSFAPWEFQRYEKYADLLDIAIVNLKEANHFEEFQDELLYMKLQKSFLLQC